MSRRRLTRHLTSATSAALASVLLFGGLMAVSEQVNVNRWDNLEFFLPTLWASQRALLGGDFPAWLPHQNLGEPLHALSQSGVLYLPYTFATALVKAFGASPFALLPLITLLHWAAAAFFFHRFLTELGVRASLAFVATLAFVFSGHAVTLSAFWVHTGPQSFVLALGLWGARRLVDGEGVGGSTLTLGAALGLAVLIGHTQYSVYTWATLGLFTVAFAIARRRVRPVLVPLGVALLGGGLLGAAQLVPTAMVLDDASRDVLSHDEFLSRGMSLGALWGLFSPAVGGPDGFLEHSLRCTTFLGAWLVPVLLAVAASRRASAGEAERGFRRVFFAATLPGLLVLWLSAGGEGGLYRLVWYLPLLSSFRWPFKLLSFAAPLLVAGGAVGLETIARGEVRRWALLGAIAVVAVIDVALLVALPPPAWAVSSVVAWAVLGCALGLVGLLAALHRPAGRGLLVALSLPMTVLVVLVAHHSGRMKPYVEDQGQVLDAAFFGIDDGARLLPLSDTSPPGARLQELALFHAAMLMDLESLTGTRFALSSRRFEQVLHVDIRGLFLPDQRDRFLASHLLRSLNVGHLIVSKDDPETLARLASVPGVEKAHDTAHAEVWRVSEVLPRAYFASEVRPFEPAAFEAGLFENQADVRAAYVESHDLPRRGLGVVTRHARTKGALELDVEVTEQGLLVVSEAAAKGFAATIDGVDAPVLRVNGLVMGVEVPPGRHLVRFVYRAPGLGLGLALAFVGLLGLLAWAWRHRRAAG